MKYTSHSKMKFIAILTIVSFAADAQIFTKHKVQKSQISFDDRVKSNKQYFRSEDILSTIGKCFMSSMEEMDKCASSMVKMDGASTRRSFMDWWKQLKNIHISSEFFHSDTEDIATIRNKGRNKNKFKKVTRNPEDFGDEAEEDSTTEPNPSDVLNKCFKLAVMEFAKCMNTEEKTDNNMRAGKRGRTERNIQQHEARTGRPELESIEQWDGDALRRHKAVINHPTNHPTNLTFNIKNV